MTPQPSPWEDPFDDPDKPEVDPPALCYPTVEDWVRDYLCPMYARPLRHVSHRTWCPQVLEHPEARIRLEALWRAWEHLRHDPALGISTWLRDHCDPHLAVLMDPDGPLAGCTVHGGHQPRTEPLPYTQLPAA